MARWSAGLQVQTEGRQPDIEAAAAAAGTRLQGTGDQWGGHGLWGPKKKGGVSKHPFLPFSVVSASRQWCGSDWQTGRLPM